MVRYLVSLAVLIGGIVFAVMLSGGGTLLWFLDIPSFIIAGIVPFLIASILFGFSAMVSAFSALQKKKPVAHG